MFEPELVDMDVKKQVVQMATDSMQNVEQ